MKYIAIFLLIASFKSFAGDKEDNNPEYQIKVYDNDIDVKEMESKGIKVIPDNGFAVEKSSLPSIEFRNKVFNESGLMELVREQDDFELDSIYIKLKQNDEMSITRLIAKYPKLNKEILKKAQKMILEKRD